jgi:hypothetical protein
MVMNERERMFDAEKRDDGSVVFTVRPPKLDFDVKPDSPLGHLLASQKEMLLAFRSLLDGAISAVDRAGASGGSQRRTRIDID